MSFHFNHLMLKDWLVYGDITEIDFPEFQSGRNLVVFNGRNGFGKTSLLRALGFVFNGKASKQELLDLWNERARDTGEGSVEVGLEFSHGQRNCKLIRGADFRPWGSGIATTPWVKLIIDGREETDQIDDKIEQLLPRECLDFIFFDGAEIGRYAKKQHETGVRDAIEKVLGIPAVRNLRDDLAKLIDDLEDEQQKLLSRSDAAASLLAEVEGLRDEIDTYTQRRAEQNEKKESLQATLTELHAEAEGIEAIERERKELMEKQRRRADLEERQTELSNSIRAAISQTPLLLLEEPLGRIVEALRATQKPSPRRDSHHARLQVARDVIENGECLCGCEVTDKIRQRLQEEIARLETRLDGMPARSATSDEFLELSGVLRTLQSYDRDPEALIDKRAAADTQLEEIETDIRRLSEALEGHEVASVNELFQQIGQIRQQIGEAEGRIHSIDGNIDVAESQLQQKQRELDRIGVSTDQARGVTQTLDMARRLHAALVELVDTIVESKRHDVEDTASEIFRQITNKPEEYDRLRLNDDYSLEVVRHDSSVVENEKLSAGEKEVVAYSFITSLNLASTDPAPFVMDTPFGHLDAGHRKGLLRSLPRLQVQAMLLATDRDLPADERDSIDDSIAKEFTLRRDQRRAITSIAED